MLPIKSCYMGIVLLATCLTLSHCALEPSIAVTDTYADNGAEKNEDTPLTIHKRPSFFVGSRYGRSGVQTSPFGGSKMRRLNVVPRNDRFFLGSRYGKRSGEYAAPYEQDNMTEDLPNGMSHKTINKSYDDGNGNGSGQHMLSCIYTGLRNYYRCNSIEEINTFINQLAAGQGEDDRK